MGFVPVCALVVDVIILNSPSLRVLILLLILARRASLMVARPNRRWRKKRQRAERATVPTGAFGAAAYTRLLSLSPIWCAGVVVDAEFGVESVDGTSGSEWKKAVNAEVDSARSMSMKARRAAAARGFVPHEGDVRCGCWIGLLGRGAP